jgi:hypothetical protein
MGLGLSLFFIISGAILAWAVTAQTDGIDLTTTGYIVFGIGCFGVASWLVNWLITLRKIVQLPPTGQGAMPPPPPPPAARGHA